MTCSWVKGMRGGGEGGNTYTFTLRAISEADSSPPAKHRQSALVLACSYRCQENQAQFYNLDRKTWYECLCCSEAGLYSFVKIIIIRCQFCSLMEKKEQFYELQTLLCTLKCISVELYFFCTITKQTLFLVIQLWNMWVLLKKPKKKTRGASPLCEAPRILTRLWAMKLSNTKFPQYGKIKRKACSNCSVS